MDVRPLFYQDILVGICPLSCKELSAKGRLLFQFCFNWGWVFLGLEEVG
jgi:hypothetical protein